MTETRLSPGQRPTVRTEDSSSTVITEEITKGRCSGQGPRARIDVYIIMWQNHSHTVFSMVRAG